MKIKQLVFMVFFLLSCTPTNLTPTVEIISTPSAIPTENVVIPTSTPNVLPENILEDLTIAYRVRDDIDLYSIWIWKHNALKKVLQQKHIYKPIISSDGEWLIFLQLKFVTDHNLQTDEIWLMRTDGSDLQLLLSSDELNNLSYDGRVLDIIQIDWIPNQEKLLFTTNNNFAERPGIDPNFDLYSLDLKGQITKLADPEDGGHFTISPNGQYVAVASRNRIGIINLETSENLTLLNFEPFLQPCECYSVPPVFWNTQSDFILTEIRPYNLLYSDYIGEPVRVWKLSVNGQIELVTEFQPPSIGIEASSNFKYFFYSHVGCDDKVKMSEHRAKKVYSGSGPSTLYIYNLEHQSGEAYFCFSGNSIEWMPDSEHFIYHFNGLWQLGDINDKNNSQPIEFLNMLNEFNVGISEHWVWIDDEYFLLKLQNEETCTLNIATLQGIVKEVIRTDVNKYCLANDVNINFSQ